MLKTENFSSLSYDYYEGENLEKFKKAVQICQNFIKSFDKDYRNLFFYGTVGTGKSFLSCCVAKELMDMGKLVIYFSASQLFDTLSKSTFDKDSKEAVSGISDDIYNCDLLIIDDLGTELTNSFVASQLFSCLNNRHLRKKTTIINTNLSLGELRDRYSDRIFSRITSNYEVCKLTGRDIRVQKKTARSN
jgi:DNA replication protein DnaC